MDNFKQMVEEFRNFFELEYDSDKHCLEDEIQKIEGNNSGIDLLEEYLFEMSNLRPSETGLPMVVWILPKSGREKHGPRIKVQTKHGRKMDASNTVSVSVSDKPKIMAGSGLSQKDFKIISAFINKHKEALMGYWDEELSTMELISKLNKK